MASSPNHRPCRSSHRFFPLLGLLLALCLPLQRAGAQDEKTANDEFSQEVKLAPFVVNGQSLAISIHARTKSDRRYGEQFSGGVSKIVHEAVTESTGKGLVIIGAKGEPHPTLVFQKFLALAEAGKLDPAIAAHGPELSAMMNRWQDGMRKGEPDEAAAKKQSVDLDFDQILTALPLPLAAVAAKLYQLAWEEKFDDAKVEAKLCALRPVDLERRELFKAYDWVFYLPPKGAFDRVLDDIISAILKRQKMGFASRMAIKGVLLVVKPKIRRMVEAMRQGLLFTTMLEARTPYTKDDRKKLTQAYIDVFMPGEKLTGGSDHERAVKAVRDCLRQIEEKAEAVELPVAPTAGAI